MLLSAQYIVPVTADPIENGAILVRDGRIADIGSSELMRLRYPNDELKDFGIAAITPGFIDLHARIEDAVFRGLIADVPFVQWNKQVSKSRSALTRREAYESAFLGGLEELASGVTTVADTTRTGACVSALNDLGMRGQVYFEAAAVEKAMVSYAMKKLDTDIAKWSAKVDSSRISFGVAPAPTYECHPELYRTVAQYVGENGDLPISICLAGSKEEDLFVRNGAAVGLDARLVQQGFVDVPPWLPTKVSPINYVMNWGLFEAKNVLMVYGSHVDVDEIDALKKHDVSVAVCPSLNAQLGMGVAPTSEYLRAGLRVGLGTGAPASIDFLDIFTEMRVEMLLQRASHVGSFMDSQTLLEMGTIRAAEVLGKEKEIGSLEVGKKADVVAIDLSGSHQSPTTDPVAALLSSASGSDVVFTMVDGNVLYEQGRWSMALEAAKNIAQVLEIRGRLRS